MEQEPIRAGLVTVQFHPTDTLVQSWDVNDRSLIESKQLDAINDIDSQWGQLSKAIEGLDVKPSKNTTIMFITNEWSNTKTSDEITTEMESLEMKFGHPVEMVDADEMAAVTAWESIGKELDECDQFKWLKKSRVVCLGVYHDHTGIALVEAGRIIGGMGLPQDSFPWSNIMLRNYEDNGSGFHGYLIKTAINDYIATMYAPDVTVVYIDDPDIANEISGSITAPGARIIGERSEEDSDKSAGYGAMLHWIKEQIGWRAFFIDDAIKDDDEQVESMVIGGDGEDDTELIDEIHDMMRKLGEEEAIVLPTPSTTTVHDDEDGDDSDSTPGESHDDDAVEDGRHDDEPTDDEDETSSETGPDDASEEDSHSDDGEPTQSDDDNATPDAGQVDSDDADGTVEEETSLTVVSDDDGTKSNPFAGLMSGAKDDPESNDDTTDDDTGTDDGSDAGDTDDKE